MTLLDSIKNAATTQQATVLNKPSLNKGINTRRNQKREPFSESVTGPVVAALAAFAGLLVIGIILF